MFKPKAAFSGFSCKDPKETQAFYSETLGLEVKDNGMGLELELPEGGKVFVYPKGDQHQPAGFTILNFVVSDINTAVDALKEKGVTFEIYDNMPFKQDERGIARGIAAKMGPDIAWFKDPSDNILAVLQNE